MLGVEAIIIGSVTEFALEKSSLAVDANALGKLTRGVFGGGKRVNTKARVGITARLVDSSTGAILTAVSGRGESDRASVSAEGGLASGAMDKAEASFGQTMLGDAVKQAVQAVASNLNALSSTLRIAHTGYRQPLK